MGRGFRGDVAGVASIDMVTAISIFLFAFSIVTVLIVSTPTGSGTDQIQLQSAALRVSALLVTDGGWYGDGNVTASVGPTDGGVVLDTKNASAAGNVNWERKWDSSRSEVDRIGFMARIEDFRQEPGEAAYGNETYSKVLSIYKVDGVRNDTFSTEGLMIRHPAGVVGDNHGSVNETWWWDFGRTASHNVSGSEDDVSDAEYDVAREAMGLGFRSYNLYMQLRPVNGSLFNETVADDAVEGQVPDLDRVVTVERTVMLTYYDTENEAWRYVKKDPTAIEPVRYRLVLYVW